MFYLQPIDKFSFIVIFATNRCVFIQCSICNQSLCFHSMLYLQPIAMFSFNALFATNRYVFIQCSICNQSLCFHSIAIFATNRYGFIQCSICNQSICFHSLLYLQLIDVFSFNALFTTNRYVFIQCSICNQSICFHSMLYLQPIDMFSFNAIFATNRYAFIQKLYLHSLFCIRPLTEINIYGRFDKYYVACCLVPRCYPTHSWKHIAFVHSCEWPYINFRFIDPEKRNCMFIETWNTQSNFRSQFKAPNVRGKSVKIWK
jgi:transcription elongation factor Elf1